MVQKKSSSGVGRLGKNKKTYWRKGVDVSDLEKFEDVSKQNERLGLTQKSDNELFFIHKDPSNNLLDEQKQPKKIITRCQLRCLKNLEPLSAVPPIVMSKTKQKARRFVDRKKLEKKNRVIPAPNIVKETADSDAYDLWDEKNIVFFGPKLPSSIKRITTILPVVETPLAGQSYNPNFEDHQVLLKQALDEENRKEKESVKLAKKLAATQPLATAATKFAEECQGLTILGTNNDEDEDVKPDLEDLQQPKPLINQQPKPKSRRQRKKMHAHQLKEKLRLKDKSIKAKQQDLLKAKSYLKAIRKSEIEINKKSKERKIKKATVKLTTANKLGKTLYNKPDLELKLNSELSGNLRNLQPEGNLMQDRFKSFQRRNLIEGRKLTGFKRKYALRKYTKPDCDVTSDYTPR